MKTFILISGIVILIVGFIIRIKKSKYDFDNRTDGGVIKHKSYGSSITHTLGKAISTLMMIGGVILILYSFIYDPYSGDYPRNWNSMTDIQKQSWKYYQDNPEKVPKPSRLSKYEIYKLLKGKEFEDWAKELEKETNLSHLYWRDIADSTNKHTDFETQEKRMKKDGYDRASIKRLKDQYEFNPDNPLHVLKADMKKREQEKKNKLE